MTDQMTDQMPDLDTLVDGDETGYTKRLRSRPGCALCWWNLAEPGKRHCRECIAKMRRCWWCGEMEPVSTTCMKCDDCGRNDGTHDPEVEH